VNQRNCNNIESHSKSFNVLARGGSLATPPWSHHQSVSLNFTNPFIVCGFSNNGGGATFVGSKPWVVQMDKEWCYLSDFVSKSLTSCPGDVSIKSLPVELLGLHSEKFRLSLHANATHDSFLPRSSQLNIIIIILILITIYTDTISLYWPRNI
jgi:hypothetical protein